MLLRTNDVLILLNKYPCIYRLEYCNPSTLLFSFWKIKKKINNVHVSIVIKCVLFVVVNLKKNQNRA